MKNYIDEKRGDETTEERQRRLEDKKNYIDEQRGDETVEETEKRMRKNKELKRQKKSYEDPKSKKQRLKKEAELKEVYRKKIAALAKEYQARSYEQTDIDKFEEETVVTRRKVFQEAIYIGPIYVCSCCHRTLFKNSVSIVSEYLKGKVIENNEELMVCLTGYESPDKKSLNLLHMSRCTLCWKDACYGCSQWS